MKSMTKMLFAGASALALTATTASAEIICNDDGDCWHVREHVEYRPEFRLHVHPDSWNWAEHDHFRWREHAGRGYWRDGVWVDIR